MRNFLNRFMLQMHHLPANDFNFLACLVTTAEGYLGIKATWRFFERLFYLKRHMSSPGVLYACGTADIVCRQGTILFEFPCVDSARKWQKTYFYVKNVLAPPGQPPRDNVNQPVFINSPPTDQATWGQNLKETIVQINEAVARLEQLVMAGLTARDIMAAWIARRVQPLQRRPHQMCFMSGRKDPCQISKNEISHLGCIMLIIPETVQHVPDWR
jgi:hypothetical protein